MNSKNWLTLILAAALCTACSSEPNNDANNNNGANHVADMGNNTFVDVDNTGAEYAMQYEVRFDSLAFNTQPANQLNMLLNANLDLNLDYPILILLRLTEIDAEAGTLRLDGGSGLKTGTEGEFMFDPESEPLGSEGTLDAATGEFTAEISYFGFIATFVYEGDVNKTELPVNELSITGQLNLVDEGVGASVVNGTLAGFMTKDDADETFINLAPGSDPVSITSLFKESTLNYNSATGEMLEAGHADADSWFLAGTYTARPTTIQQ